MSRRRDRSSPFSLFSFQDIITGLCGIVILLVLVMVLDLVARRDAAPPPPVPDAPVDPAATEDALRSEIAALEEAISRAREALAKRRVATAGGVSAERLEEANRDLSEREKEIAALLSQLDALKTRLEKARDADAQSKKALLEMEKTRRDLETARRDLETALAALRDRKGVTLIPERGNLKSPVYIVIGRGQVEIHRPLDKGAHAVRAPQRDVAETVRSVLSPLDRSTHTVVLIVRPSGASDMMPLAELVKDMGFACGRDPLEEDADVSFGAPEGGAS